MNCNLPKITYPTLRILLLLKIHEAISLWGDVLVSNAAIGNAPHLSKVRNFKLFESKDVIKQVFMDTSYAAYSTAIALKLSAAYQQPVSDILRHLADFFSQSATAAGDADAASYFRVFSDLTVTFTDEGIGLFQFGDAAIAAWLKFLTDTKLHSERRTGNRQQIGEEVWLGQKSHARCCALLRLGAGKAREIDWLTEEGKLRVSERVDRKLLFQTIAVVDALGEEIEQPKKALKLLRDLSLAFGNFDREYQILGALQGTTPQVAQCRLGLVMITRWLFAQLLEQELGVYAPVEL